MPQAELICMYTVVGTPTAGICMFCLLRTYNSFRYRERESSIHVIDSSHIVEPSHIVQHVHMTEPLQIAEQIERLDSTDVQLAETIPIDATLVSLQHHNQEALYI